MVENYLVILWDFDGVIIDSNSVRVYGFEKVLSDYPPDLVARLIEYHNQNGGLSRYVKFKYFYEEILHEEVTDEKINELANSFSVIMKSHLVNTNLLIEDSLNFIRLNFKHYHMHIVSGSDQTELRHLCTELKLTPYFKSIYGSPTNKSILVKNVIEENNYSKNDCILIGDSINDYEAASNNNIEFIGYNNLQIIDLGKYIHKFSQN
jgi:phosphoglycolate phosphatase-like HAD superfamily hydrolase